MFLVLCSVFFLLVSSFLFQVILQSEQLRDPVPGVREIALARKPAAECRASAQKLVKGTLLVSLEASHVAGAPGPAAATSEMLANTNDSVGASPLAEEDAAKANVVLDEGRPPFDLRKIDCVGKNATQTRQEGEDIEEVNAAESSQGSPARRPLHEPDTQSFSGQLIGGKGEEHEGWEGVPWDDDHMGVADSLGDVSVNVSTMEGTYATQGAFRDTAATAEPHPLLVCVRGVSGLKQVKLPFHLAKTMKQMTHRRLSSYLSTSFIVVQQRMPFPPGEDEPRLTLILKHMTLFHKKKDSLVSNTALVRARSILRGSTVFAELLERPDHTLYTVLKVKTHSSFCLGTRTFEQVNNYGISHLFCIVKEGRHEIGRTRPLKYAPELVWDRPAERFRLAIDEMGRATSAQASTSAETSNVGASAKVTADVEDEFAARFHGNPPATTGPPAVASSTLFIQVWSKRVLEGREEHIGTAVVPPLEVEHPSGDVWLPLEAREATAGSMIEGIGGESHGAKTNEDVHGGVSGPFFRSSVPGRDVQGRPGTKSRRAKFFEAMRVPRERGLQKYSKTGAPQVSTGSVHIWLGKACKSSLSGRQPGRGRVVLSVHAASGLRKVSSESFFSIPTGHIARTCSRLADRQHGFIGRRKVMHRCSCLILAGTALHFPLVSWMPPC